MDTNTRDRMLAKIRALQSKTVENGCSEAEAMAAAEKAVQLLTAYNIDQTEVDIQAAAHRDLEIDIGKGAFHPVEQCASGIAALTDTIVWKTKGRTTGRWLRFFGEEQDLAVAGYLVDVIRRSMDSEWAAFKAQCVRSRTFAHKPSFMSAMARRVHDRLTEMKREQQRQTMAATGRSLVVVKTAVVRQAFADLGIKLKAGKTSQKRAEAASYDAGREAGGRVSLNRGVGQSGYSAMIR